ncbi:Aste57867_21860 [Aphanomyces stellatus]|uniref:Aste57867_21860 protein n=1 Tax=Aphanomyces stellatus TaxID=120398 RepID=A0A485LIM6_9STRA|nr:hypothetical protein As57867_021791 [Aphanomyces stellatus]VFT98529.1 Aste57867_21860 [Aphanomyces stellatus]
MGSEEIWNNIKAELFALSIQDIYMLLNVVCLLVFVYYLVCVLLGWVPKEKKPDPTILHAYSFGHWWLWILLGVANTSQRLFGVRMFAIPAEKLKALARATPQDAASIFGSPDATIALFDTVIDDLTANKSTLSPYGRYMATKELSTALVARKAFMEYVVEHPELLHQAVPAPIVITGLPRTGMHLLYNLLALDVTSRAPRHYEAEAQAYSAIAPPVHAVDSDHMWFKRSYHGWESTYRLAPELYEALVSCQYMDPVSFCEDTIVMNHEMPSPFLTTVLGDAARRALVALPNSTNVYAYLRIYLQMLQTAEREPPARWLLKAPFHASHLPDLLNTFPDAKVVVVHRKMTDVVPSLASYLLKVMHPALRGAFLDKKHLGKVAMDLCTEKAAAMAEFRANSTKSQGIVDVDYDDLVDHPIDLVKKLYAGWNLVVSDEFAAAMDEYMTEKPKGKYGDNKYTLEEFGLSDMVIDTLFAKYANHNGKLDFDVPVPGSPTVQSA